MRRLFVMAALMGLTLVVFPPVFAQEKGAEVDPKLVAKALSNPFVQGKIIGIDKETKVITVQVVVDSKKTLNPEMQKKYQVVYAQAAQAFKANDKKKYALLQEEAKGVLAMMYDVKETVTPVMFKGEGTQVRLEKLPDRVGDDGKAKPYTPDEIKKAKGDDVNAPGFTANAEELDVEKLVRVYFPADQKKGAPPAGEQPYSARVILILPPPPGSLPGLPAPVGGGGVNPFIVK